MFKRTGSVLTLLLLLSLVTGVGVAPVAAGSGPAVFINEIHYDNAGTDTGEAIEVAAPAGTDLTGWSLVLYNGNGGVVYQTVALNGTVPDQSNGYGTVFVSVSGIQNGAPDGVALIDNNGAVVQFLSYEGSFTATDGPAAGMTSQDIGVAESWTTAVGASLQLSGSGNTYDDFSWVAAQTATFGNVNTGQTFGGTPIILINEFQPNAAGADPDPMSFEIKGPAGAAFDLWIVSLENDGYNGLVDRAARVTGTFAANGLAVVSIPDLENPSFTVVLTDNFTGTVGTTDVDPANDGVLDLSAFGHIYDALGVSDSTTDDAVLYGETLGGANIYFNGQYEPLLVFRDGTTGQWYNTVTVDYGQPTQHVGVFDASGSGIELNGSDFDNDPTVSDAFNTFGSVNPSYTPPADTSPPQVQAFNPADDAADVRVNTNLIVTFDENVQAGNGTITIHAADGTIVQSVAVTDSAVTFNGTQMIVDLPNDLALNTAYYVNLAAGIVQDQAGNAYGGIADSTTWNFTTEATITPSVLQSLVFNEVLPDPNSATYNFDTDGDGVAETSDEFLEVYNTSDTALDIGGLQFWDAGNGQYLTIPAGTTLAGHGFVLVVANVAGGALPAVPAGSHAFSAGGNLSLSNTGDNLVLYDPATDEYIQAIYNGDAADNPPQDYSGFSATAVRLGNVQDFGSDLDGTSLALSPDGNVNNAVRHVDIAPGGVLATPGQPNRASACGLPATAIHEIQGSGAASPLVGSQVTIEGIVVGDFQTGAGLQGFFVQEEAADWDADPKTSEGIFVYDGFAPPVDVNMGDLVRVTGTVVEHYELTELNAITQVEICNTNVSASPVDVTLPVDALSDWENYEGMLIQIQQPLYVTGNYTQGRYGEVELSVGGRLFNPTNVVEPGPDALALQDLNDRSRIQLEDGSTTQNPVPVPYIGTDNTLRAGDTLSGLTGVLHYAYGTYEVHPVGTITFTRVNDRPAAPTFSDATLKVAGANVLNYFVTLDDGTCPYAGGCRGADNAAEFERQRDKIIAALLALDADIVGLVEMENHPTDAALQNLVDGLNAVAGPGTYASIATGPIGSDVIKVALIYKPASVTPQGAYAILDNTVDPTFNDDKNRPALAQTFTENATGETFTVVVNHLKSKGSPCDDIGDPDAGDGQGNCNQTRTAAATALVNWLATDPTGSGDPDFLLIGDYNAYALEDPIDAIKAGGYLDLIAKFVNNPYSFVFAGQAGYLDHALASQSLAAQVVGVAEWHINADEPSVLDYQDYNQPAGLYQADAFRASDHDPVVVGLRLGSAPTVVFGAKTFPAQNARLNQGLKQIQVQFNQPVIADGGPDAANYTGNYLLVEAGNNGQFDTQSCAAGLAADDVQFAISAAVYDPTENLATLTVNNGVRLPAGVYRLFICGTTSILSQTGYHLNGDLVSGADSTLDFTILATPATLPDTGFVPMRLTRQPAQPPARAYTALDIGLQIPTLGVQTRIVGVPRTAEGWQVDWLGDQVGWLEGSAFPTWSGNTVLTGHVWDAFNQPGVFARLKTLRYGDEIRITAFGATYVYAVRENRLVRPSDVAAAWQHETQDWVTLITCEFYNPLGENYLFRRLVRAVLVRVE